MTDVNGDRFVSELLPVLERIARNQVQPADPGAEDRIAEFLARCWEAYVALAFSGASAGHLAGGASEDLFDRTQLWSLSHPLIRRAAERLPAHKRHNHFPEGDLQ